MRFRMYVYSLFNLIFSSRVYKFTIINKNRVNNATYKIKIRATKVKEESLFLEGKSIDIN